MSTLSALLDEGLGEGRAGLQVGLGRKEPTHSAAMFGISSLDTGKQSRQSVEIQPQSSKQVKGWSSILDSPDGVPRVPGMGSSGSAEQWSCHGAMARSPPL